MQAQPMRLWWLEVVRGVLGLLLTALLLTHFVQTLHDVLVIFGGYLILDSLGDSYRIATEPRRSRRRWLDYTMSAFSVLVGVACIIQPYVTGVLLLYLLLTRLLVQGVGELRAAWRHRGRLAGIEWLYGGGLLLAAILMIVVPHIIFAFFFAALVLYLIINNCALLVRGILLHVAPQRLLARSPQPTLLQADLSPAWPASTRRALVFVRHEGANGLGHVGWAFEWHNGWFNTGAVENHAGWAIAAPATMDFWSWHTLDPVGAMQGQMHPYDEYKVFHVPTPQPKSAWQTVVWESRRPYLVIEHNCSDIVYDVLRAYGVGVLTDPAEHIIPNDWYAMLPGPSFPMSAFPTLPVHLHRSSQSPITLAPLVLTIPPTIVGTAPRWRAGRAWTEAAALFDKMISDIGALVNHQKPISV